MDHVKIIQAIKKAQYETFKRIMRESKATYRVPARVGLTRKKEKEFKERMRELDQKYYFWTIAHDDVSDLKLVECRDQNMFSVFIYFPVFSERLELWEMQEHARRMVNNLQANGLTAVWQGGQSYAIEVIIGVDTVAANVMEVQCTTFDELFA
jgi:hypothetical protein